MIKKIIAGLLIVGVVVGLGIWALGLSKVGEDATTSLKILATNYPAYDFARAVTQGNGKVEVEMLVAPGMEVHDFEPTPQEMIEIRKSNVFIYGGGESEGWAEEILEGAGEVKVLSLMDLAGAERNEDEHVWTSPVMVMKIVEQLGRELGELDPENAEQYRENVKRYKGELERVDKEMREVVGRAKRKELVVGDRFPLRYFVNEYGLKYVAAFTGCSEQTEASAQTIAKLVTKVREEKTPVVLKMEMSQSGVAEAIAEETGAEVMEFQSGHLVSQEEFKAGVTYVDLMERNVKALERALY